MERKFFLFCCLAVSLTAGTTQTTTASQDCCQDVQNQLDYLYSQVSFLLGENEKKDSEISDLQEQVSYLEGELERIENSPLLKSGLRSCEDILLAGYTESGIYTIDPDGPNAGLLAFDVYCDFETDPPTTKIGHDAENGTLVNGCQDPGCFSRDIDYDISMEQILSVISRSKTCKQYIKYECLASMMFTYSDFVWWISRDGEEQHYWGGALPDSHMCECGRYGTCANKATNCNCDNNDEIWREDAGYLTAKDSLPVTAAYFGDVSGVLERGIFTLGKLECQGTEKNVDCKSLKEGGYPSGYYEINPNPLELLEPFTVYCDMESNPGTGITVVSHDKPGKNGPYYYPNKHIEFNYDNVSLSNIEELIKISENCRQYVEWQCYRTGFFGTNSYTSWESRNGTEMRYWGGADPSHDEYCACGETGNCEPNGYYGNKCNCDDLDSTTRVDGGFLTDKTSLPVTAFNFGFYYSSSSYDGYYTLGNLECY